MSPTQARPQGTSTQLDAAEALARVKSAKQLSETLAQHASTHTAGTLQAVQDKQPLPELIKTLEARHRGPQGGQSEKIHAQGSRSEAEAAHTFGQPIIALDSAASLVTATPASLSWMSGESASLTAHGDTHLAAGSSASLTAAREVSLFTATEDLAAIAATGPLTLRAHTDALELAADKSVTVTSSSEGIDILAQNKIVLSAGQSQIELDGANISFTCPGTFMVKGSSHAFEGGGSGAVSPPELPMVSVAHVPDAEISLLLTEPAQFSERLAVFSPITGECVALPYVLLSNGAVVEKGRTGGDGLTPRRIREDTEQLHALIGPKGEWAIEYHDNLPTLAPAHDGLNDSDTAQFVEEA